MRQLRLLPAPRMPSVPCSCRVVLRRGIRVAAHHQAVGNAHVDGQDVAVEQRVIAVQRGKPAPGRVGVELRSEEHTSELQALMRISYAGFCLKNNDLLSS